MPSFLIITRHYLDENNGGSNASKGFIWSFGYICADCTLIYPEHTGLDSSKYIPNSVKKFPVFDNRSKMRKGIDVYRGRLHRFVEEGHETHQSMPLDLYPALPHAADARTGVYLRQGLRSHGDSGIHHSGNGHRLVVVPLAASTFDHYRIVPCAECCGLSP